MLAALAALPLAGCAPVVSAPGASESASTPAPSLRPDPRYADLERQYEVRLGVYALDTATGQATGHRTDERFAYCSTFKALAAAAVLQQRSLDELDEVVHYTVDDLVEYSPVTELHVGTGMTIRALCDAAVRFSDNTAGNMLFRDLGGPQALNAVLNSVGDDITRMDRIETDLNTAVPGDIRDTTTPRAFAQNLHRFGLDDALPAQKRDTLNDWMSGNATGDALIRAGAPSGWPVSDKSGAGAYGTRNDIGIVWPPDSAPVVVVVFSTREIPDASYDNTLIADAARIALDVLLQEGSG